MVVEHAIRRVGLCASHLARVRGVAVPPHAVLTVCVLREADRVAVAVASEDCVLVLRARVAEERDQALPLQVRRRLHLDEVEQRLVLFLIKFVCLNHINVLVVFIIEFDLLTKELALLLLPLQLNLSCLRIHLYLYKFYKFNK